MVLPEFLKSYGLAHITVNGKETVEAVTCAIDSAFAARALGVESSSRGAWGVAQQPALQQALHKAMLKQAGFLFPSTLVARRN